MKLHGRHANIPAMSRFEDPSTVRPARAWQIIWPAFVNNGDPDWHALPVPAFGSLDAQLLVVGLGPGEKAPTGPDARFTGDVAGELLYPALHRFGFASNRCRWGQMVGPTRPCSLITAASPTRCRLPPANKPTTAEFASATASGRRSGRHATT